MHDAHPETTSNAVDAPSANGAISGRRRALSRHRHSDRGRSSRSGRRFAGPFTAVVSLIPALAVIAVVQWFSADARAVPSGAAGWAFAGSWAASTPGALVGALHDWTLPLFGWLQLGLLDRGLLALTSQSVLAVARDVQLMLTLVGATLVWMLVRRLRASGLAAGVAATLFGIVPFALTAHTAPLPANLAVVWLLAAAVFASGAPRVASALCAGVCIGLAGVTEPVALIGAVVPVWLIVRRPSARRSAVGSTHPWRRFAAAVLAAIILLGAAAAAIVVLSGLPATAAAMDLNRIADAATTHAQTIGLTSGIATALLAAAAIDAAVRALGRAPSRRIAGGILLAGVAAALVVSAATWATRLPDTSQRADAQIARTAAWLRTSVPADQVVLVDLAAWPDLSRASGARVGWYAQRPSAGGAVSSSSPWASADYVVADAQLTAHASGAAATALHRSLSVATFGTGSAALQVRAVADSPVPAGPVTMTPAEQRAADARRTSGQELASNPRLVIGGSDRALLTAGRVDSRVILVLGQLLGQHRVTVSGFPAVSGDASAVRRQVLVGGLDAHAIPADVQQTGVVLRYLSGLRGTFAVARIDAEPTGVLATFTPNLTFTPSQ